MALEYVRQFALIYLSTIDRPGVKFNTGPCPGCTTMPRAPIANPLLCSYAGLRATARGSSTSRSMTSLGDGVAVIKATPSNE